MFGQIREDYNKALEKVARRTSLEALTFEARQLDSLSDKDLAASLLSLDIREMLDRGISVDELKDYLPRYEWVEEALQRALHPHQN